MSDRSWLWTFALAVSMALCLPAGLMPLQRHFYQTRFPDYFSSWTNNGSFSLVDTFHLDQDAYPYAARMRQAGSHLLPGDPYIRENHSWRLIVRDGLTFHVLGGFFRLTQNMPAAWSLAQFVLALLWVPCLYAVMTRMGIGRGAALFVAVAVTLFHDLTRLPGGPTILTVLRAAFQYSFWLLGSYQYWFGPTRFTRPLFTYPCLFAAAWLAVRTAEGRRWPSAALSGLAGGALAYVHPDVWAAYLGATSLMTAHSCWSRKRVDWPLVLSLGLTVAAACPWLLLNSLGPEDAGMIALAARRPEWGALGYALAAVLGWRFLDRKPMVVWACALLLSVALALNGQLLIGRQGNPSLWFYLGNTFSMLLAGAFLAKMPLRRETWLWLSGFCVLLALPRAVNYATLHYRICALPKAEEEAYRWLDRHTEMDSVVATLSPMTNYRIPVHTHDKTLVSRIFALTSDISYGENARRLNYALSLFGADRRRFVDQGMDRSGEWERKLWLGEVDARSHERSGTLLGYFDMTSPEPVRALLVRAAADPGPQDYAVDYLWLGPFEKDLIGPRVRLPRESERRKVFENAMVTIFQVSRPAGQPLSRKAS